MKEQRAEKREPATGSVTYVSTTNGSEIMRTGLIANLSKSGACLLTQECVAEGKVKVYLYGLINEPIKADVVWCNEAIENLFRVGIRFRN